MRTYLRLVVIILLTVSIEIQAQTNLVVNGNFSAGYTGFTSNYTQGTNLYPEGRYAVVSNAKSVHNDFVGFDHTNPPTGLFLAVNGAGSPGVNVWCQSVTVTPNTEYDFTTWVSTLVSSSPAVLQFSINGVPLSTPFTAPKQTNLWSRFNVIWYSGTATVATICIVNQNTSGSGNDFGLDDISFVKYCSLKPSVRQVSPICTGKSVQLNASGGDAYRWTPTSGLDNPNIPNPTASPSVTTRYTVEVSYRNCTETASATVNVLPYPIADAGADRTICNGDSTRLGSVPVTGLSYSWLPVQGLDNPSSATPSAFPVTTTQYILTVDNSGCTSYDTVRITVNDLSARLPIDSQHVCPGTSITTRTEVSGGVPPYSYRWTALSGSGILGADTMDSLTVLHSKPGIYNYRCTITDASGCHVDKIASLIYRTPPSVTLRKEIFGCPNERTTISATISGGVPPYRFEWRANDTASVSVLYAVEKGQIEVQSSAAGTYSYTLYVTDVNGCRDSANVKYTVIELPTLSNGADSPVVTCLEASRPPTTIGDKITLSGGTPPYTYVWREAGGGTSTFVGSTTTLKTEVKPDITTRYTLTVTDTDTNRACPLTYDVLVEVRPVPDAPISYDQTICACEATSVAQLGGEAKCGVPPYQYEWSPTIGLTNPSSTTTARTTAKPTQTTTYILTVTDGQSRIVRDTVIITVVPCPIATGDTVLICDASQPQTLGITVKGVPLDGMRYSWAPIDRINSRNAEHPLYSGPDSNSTMNYRVRVIDKFGCQGSTDVVVITSKTMSVHPTSSIECPQKICRGIDSVTLTAVIAGGQPPFEITWTSSLPVADFPKNGASVVARPLETTTFTALVTDANGCTRQGSVVVCVDPVPNVNTGPADTICVGSSITIGQPSTCGEKFVYSWATHPYLVHADRSKPEAIFTPTTPGTYTLSLTVQDQDGGAQSKSTTGTVTIIARENPQSTLTLSTPLLCACSIDTSSITARGIGGRPPYTFIWSAAGVEKRRDINVTTSTLPLKAVTTSGYYNVATIDANGCQSVDSAEVRLRPCPTVNVTSPTICECDSVRLNVEISGNPNDYTFTWTNQDGSPAVQISDPTSQNPTVFPKASTTYKLVTTEKSTGCTATAVSPVVVGKDSSPSAVFRIPSVVSDPRNKNLSIPIVVEDFTPSMSCLPKEVQLSLTYNENLFDPNPRIENGSVGRISGSIIANTTAVQNGESMRTLTIRCSPIAQLDRGDILLTVTGAALIGSPGFTDITVHDVQWVCSSTMQTMAPAVGRLTLDSLCLLPNGSKRLLTFIPTASVVALIPNPNNGSSSIALRRYNGEEVHITIYSPMGQELHSTLWAKNDATGEEVASFPIQMQPVSGVYHIVVRTAGGVSTEQLIIVQ